MTNNSVRWRKKKGDVASAATIIIRPPRGLVPINFGEVWAYRELLYLFIWRDIKLRYKQTILGVAWAVIRPLLMMVVFSVIFGNLLRIDSEGIPYPLFNYAALLPWTLFAEGVTRSSNSLVEDAQLVQKAYFPRLIKPLASSLAPVVDFAIAFVILIGMMFFFRIPLTLRMLWLPVFLLLTMITTMGVGLWMAAINVQYRDVRYALPFAIQLWLFISPVVYSSAILPGPFQVIYGVNPMAGVIEGFRWALLGTTPPGSMIAISVTIVIVLLISGVYYFRHIEKIFADVV